MIASSGFQRAFQVERRQHLSSHHHYFGQEIVNIPRADFVSSLGDNHFLNPEKEWEKNLVFFFCFFLTVRMLEIWKLKFFSGVLQPEWLGEAGRLASVTLHGPGEGDKALISVLFYWLRPFTTVWSPWKSPSRVRCKKSYCRIKRCLKDFIMIILYPYKHTLLSTKLIFCTNSVSSYCGLCKTGKQFSQITPLQNHILPLVSEQNIYPVPLYTHAMECNLWHTVIHTNLHYTYIFI